MGPTVGWSALLVTLVALLHVGDVRAVCGYKGCPATKSKMINVHLVPHTHDDVGWLKTVDQYYYGGKSSIQHAGVQYILDNVVQALLKDPKRRFIYVESAFFFKWYNEQTDDMKQNVIKLVNEGRLEFVGGAWSMNDEAAVHYQSVIDQFTVGLKMLSETFGSCARPRIGWQIDPFGHSREMASIFAQMGYDGQFFSRMDYSDKAARLKNLSAEMVWHASDDLGQRAELFTGLLYNHYSAPPGFCFDALCSDEPIIDGESFENNVERRVLHFIEYITNVTKHYRPTHLLIPMGDDFNYENANMNFKNMDKLIKYVNKRQALGSNVNVFYSTPGCYLNAVHQLPLTWPNKTQDFFPYSTDWHTYWTGYYSSRPTQKRFERDGNHFLQVIKQLTTLANLTGPAVDDNLNQLRHAMGVMQHHDAITGTERQRVAKDYDRLLAAAMARAQANARMALQQLSNLSAGEFEICPLLNISVCEFVQQGADNVVVTIFNPLAHPSTQFVRVPVRNESFTVTDAAGAVIPSEVVPLPKELVNLHFRPRDTQFELVFSAYVEKLAHFYINENVQPREMTDNSEHRFQRIVPGRSQQANSVFEAEAILTEVDPRADTVVQNSLVKLVFDSSGHLKQISMNGITENVRQDFYYYRGAVGNNGEFKNRSSGAYIFRPNGTELLIGPKVELKVYNGAKVKEVHQRFDDWVSQVIRIYEGVVRVEFEWLIGPIPIDDGYGKEVITRFTSNLQTKGVFLTDSNGREMLRRVRNQRENFKPNMTEPVSGNYYPVTARLVMEDERTRIALLNDRSQGGTSMQDGQLELMLHRRLLNDDAFGVGEALNETEYGQGVVARGKVYLIMSSKPQGLSLYERLAQQEIHLPFWKFFSSASTATNKVPPKIADFSSVPFTVQVLTLEPYTTNERLLRLENFMDHSETQTASFNIRAIFDQLGGEEIRETTLDGNMQLSDMKRFKFQEDGSTVNKVAYYTSHHTPLTATKADELTEFNITLDPMQIRTFIIKWKL